MSGELFEEELVLEERDVVLVARLGREELRGLEEAPAVLQRVEPGLVRGQVAVAGGRGRLAGAVVARPAHDLRVERGRGEVEHQHLLPGGRHAISSTGAGAWGL